MCQIPTGEVNVSTNFKLPTYHRDRLYHILLGDYAALMDAINRMAVCGYCDGQRPVQRTIASPG
jgi:hypothetical protein